jgi:hypothetical protein
MQSQGQGRLCLRRDEDGATAVRTAGDTFYAAGSGLNKQCHGLMAKDHADRATVNPASRL